MWYVFHDQRDTVWTWVQNITDVPHPDGMTRGFRPGHYDRFEQVVAGPYTLYASARAVREQLWAGYFRAYVLEILA